MKTKRFVASCFLTVVSCLLVQGVVWAQSQPYYPPAGSWERKPPGAVGMDAALLAKAVEFAMTQETNKPMDFSDQERIFGEPLGPLPKRRAHTNGLVVRHGYIVAEFGETTKVDPTYSAAKSYLSTIAGLAVDQGLIDNVHDPVGKDCRPDPARKCARCRKNNNLRCWSFRGWSHRHPEGGSQQSHQYQA